jgi:hypothetical protein
MFYNVDNILNSLTKLTNRLDKAINFHTKRQALAQAKAQFHGTQFERALTASNNIKKLIGV